MALGLPPTYGTIFTKGNIIMANKLSALQIRTKRRNWAKHRLASVPSHLNSAKPFVTEAQSKLLDTMIKLTEKILKEW